MLHKNDNLVRGLKLSIRSSKEKNRPGWMELWATWSSGRCPCSWQRGWNQM